MFSTILLIIKSLFKKNIMKLFILGIISLLNFGTLFSQNNIKENLNILFIAIDDLKPTLGSYGDSFAITPNIDAIAKTGTTFLNNHTQQAVCGPSRASLLTGKRPDYTKVWDLKTKMRDINPDILSIPQYFKENGYETIGLGKIYDPRCVDKDKDKPSWSVPFISEGSFKYPDGYNPPALGFYQSKEVTGKINELKNKAKKNGEKDLNKYVRDHYKPPYEIGDVPDGAYVDGAIANTSIELLDKMDTGKPFFLAVGFKRPHLPFVAPRKYWDMYDDSKVQIAAYQKKSKNAVDIAYHNSGEMRSYKTPDISYTINSDNLLALDTDLQKKLIHGYYAATSYIDAQVGKIIEKLKQKGLDKNTIIVIWGDHGWHLGDHSLWNKHSNFEQATRSPMIIYDPRVNKGNKVEMPTEFVDLFPTLCDMVGLEMPKKLDGISLKAQVEGQNNSSKLYAVSQYPRGNRMGYSFRTKNQRYTVWVNNKKSTEPIYVEDIIGEELYDYRKDPNETDNKINQPDYQQMKSAFQTLATRYFKSQIVVIPFVKKSVDKVSIAQNKYAETRANAISDFIVSKMRLSSSKATFLNKILYEKYALNAEKVNGKNLSQAEKQVVYKSTYSIARKKLLEQFTSDEVSEISKLELEKQKALRNN